METETPLLQTPETRPSGASKNLMLLRFFTAPFEARSYANLLYLALAFPLGLAYFVFLITGLSVGLGLVIVWVGIPILALVFAGSWGLAALERRMAIHLLGVPVPPMQPPAPAAPRRFLTRVKELLANPVTWKGMGYLLVKFPLGMLTFIALTFLLALSFALIAAPFLYRSQDLFFGWWWVDTLGKALLCSLLGLVFALVSLNLLNGLAWVWKQLSRAMLGSERFALAEGAKTA
jgi:hypothetical protein